MKSCGNILPTSDGIVHFSNKITLDALQPCKFHAKFALNMPWQSLITWPLPSSIFVLIPITTLSIIEGGLKQRDIRTEVRAFLWMRLSESGETM